MEKYGLSRRDFIKYKDYFFKILEKTNIENEDNIANISVKEKSVKQKHDKSFKDILMDKDKMDKAINKICICR